MSTQEENRASYARFVRDVLEAGNLSVLDELVSPDAVSHSLPGQKRGRAGMREGLQKFNDAFSDRSFVMRDVIAEGDKVVTHYTVSALHQGYFLGLPATGERVSYDGMSIVRFAGGKIVEHWSVNDLEGAMQRLSAAERAESGPRPSLLELAQRDVAKKFFIEYANRFNRSLAGEHVDAKEVADSFADHFVEASPSGINAGKNGLMFRWMIPSGFAQYKKLGTTSMSLEHVEVETIDPLHALAKVHWDSSYIKHDGEPDHVEFDVTYLLHFEGAKPKIFAYITGDEAQVMQQHGVS